MAAAVSSSSSSYRQKRKQAAIYISSDSDHEEEDEEESEGSEAAFDEDDGGGSEGGESEEDDDEEEEEPLSEGSAGSEADYEEDSEDGDEDDDDDADSERDGDSPEAKPSEEKLYSKVVDHLQRRRSLNTLKLEECKSYLRRHQLRLSGTKATCIERILEHWRIKDGNGEHLYPRSSFAINCTGDVCKGDVILFKQRVYQKFDIVKRGGGGNIIGKRIIAGRVVKESYGAAKQQHTFTVEILWSKGVKPLPPLSPLLVKGRNLYRLKTFRRPWSNEAERNKVLTEKHRRGAAARHVREIAKSSASRGFKRHKSSTVKAPSNKRGKIEPVPAIRKKRNMPATRMKKRNSQPAKSTSNGHVRTRQVTKVKHGESSSSTKQKHVQRNKSPPTDQAMPRQAAKARHEDSSFTNQKYAQGENGIHSHPQFPYDQMGSYQNRLANPQADRRLSQLPSYAAGYAYAGNGVPHPHLLDRGGGYMNHPYLNPSLQFDPRSSNHVFRQMHFDYGAGAPPGDQFHRQRWP